ncbi:hypothetical protein [Cupriavidus necator]
MQLQPQLQSGFGSSVAAQLEDGGANLAHHKHDACESDGLRAKAEVGTADIIDHLLELIYLGYQIRNLGAFVIDQCSSNLEQILVGLHHQRRELAPLIVMHDGLFFSLLPGPGRA